MRNTVGRRVVPLSAGNAMTLWTSPGAPPKDTRMLGRVYGRQSPDQLASAFSRALGLAPDCSAGATDQAGNGVSVGPDGPRGMDPATATQLALFAENVKAHQTLRSDRP
jgi:hypothetical protein